jgi:mono/diheme cytochrome c family protein
MADRGRAVRAAGLVVIALVAAEAAGQEERPPAPPAAQELPTRIPAGNVEHGRYLVMDVAQCVECHSPRDENGVIVPGQEFTGAPIPFRPPWPNDWAIRAPRNRGLPGYTTELGVRLLTQGAVDREGRQLRPPMPRFRMSLQDAADVVAYLKSLQ